MSTPRICRICGARISNDACDNKLCSGFGKLIQPQNSEEPSGPASGARPARAGKQGLMNPGPLPVLCLILLGITFSLGSAGYWWHHRENVRIANQSRDSMQQAVKSKGSSPPANPFDSSSPNYRRMEEMTQDWHRRPGKDDLGLAKNLLAQKQQKLDEVTKIIVPVFVVGCSVLLFGLVQMARLMRTGQRRISARDKYKV